jgi:hypothetical protein
MWRLKLVVGTIAVGLAITIPQAALACTPSLLTTEERQARTLAYQADYWNNASSVYVAQVTEIATALAADDEPLDLSRGGTVPPSLRAVTQVRLTLTPILALKGPTSSAPVSLSFSRAMMEPSVCNAPFWRNHEYGPGLGQRYLVYSGFSTPQVGGDVQTVLAIDVQDPAALAAWDAAAPQSVQTHAE